MSHVYTLRQSYVLQVAALLLLGAVIVFGLLPYLSAFLGAGILYVVVQPPWRWLTERRAWPRSAAATLLIVVSLVVIVLPFLTLSLMLAGKIAYYTEHSEELMQLARAAESWSGVQLMTPENLRKVVQSLGAHAAQWVSSAAGNVVTLLVVMGLMLFALYYMLVERERFLAGVERYLPFAPETQTQLGAALRDNVNANVVGQLFVSLVQGILTGGTLAIFGVSDPLFWGVVGFFVAFVPVLGTPLVWVPAGAIQISQGHTAQGLGILLVGVVVIVNIDNVLRMFLAKRMGNIHPMVTLAGIAMGVPMFGIVGLAFGPLLLSYFGVLLEALAAQNKARTQS